MLDGPSGLIIPTRQCSFTASSLRIVAAPSSPWCSLRAVATACQRRCDCQDSTLAGTIASSPLASRTSPCSSNDDRPSGGIPVSSYKARCSKPSVSGCRCSDRSRPFYWSSRLSRAAARAIPTISLRLGPRSAHRRRSTRDRFGYVCRMCANIGLLRTRKEAFPEYRHLGVSPTGYLKDTPAPSPNCCETAIRPCSALYIQPHLNP